MIMTAIGIGMCVIGTIGIIYTIANKENLPQVMKTSITIKQRRTGAA